MNQLNLTLGNCAKDLAGFGVMFFIVFFAFAQLGYLAFGTQVSDFGTFSTALYVVYCYNSAIVKYLLNQKSNLIEDCVIIQLQTDPISYYFGRLRLSSPS